jgi:hypothetical protein
MHAQLQQVNDIGKTVVTDNHRSESCVGRGAFEAWQQHVIEKLAEHSV